MGHELVIENGLTFDGLGTPPALRHVGISGGRVAALSGTPLEGAQRIDARGKWVLPGFVDPHTHYDAEVLVAPGLGESVRHGVTTVFLGNCSLSTVHSSALDCADLFSRVEAVPRAHVLATLERVKRWDSAAGYVAHLESLPLGPNIAAFLGHSDLRTSVMGLGRAVDPAARPDEKELERMETLLEEALAQGFLGLSSMTTPWDKLDGERYRSRSLPSTFATWREHRRLNHALRRAGGVLQSAPNTTNPANLLLFILESAGAFLRKRLRTSLLVAADSKSMPTGAIFAQLGLTRVTNLLLGGDLRWQHLPLPFELYCDGIDLPVFEEFGSGRAALHLKDELERNRLLENQAYRRQFRREYEQRFDLRMWKRDFHDTAIVACPDASVVGKSFGQVAEERGVHVVDAYLDLLVAHGGRLRWRTTVANHRSHILDRVAASPALQLGFSDAGAHLRNMAFYNFPLRFLKRVRDAIAAGRPFMTLERAVYRLTGEQGHFFGVAAGTLRLGDRADVALVDPAGLDADVDAYDEAAVPEFGGLKRMVNRCDRAVSATIVGGRIAFQDGAFASGYGREWGSGSFLRARGA
jgi:N-acyl-D-aspartate/D-glutamate deacylase